MALAAVCYLFMRPVKNNTRFLMIEIFGIERNQLGILSLVFCMTNRTIFAFITMIASSFGDAQSDLLMTGEAFDW